MQIGIIGLGRMGGNITRRLMKAGHKCVVFDVSAKARQGLAKEGAVDAGALEDMVNKLEKPRALWVMLPAGKITENTVKHLAGLLDPHDILNHSRNTFYKDDIPRAKVISAQQIRFNDCDTSAGDAG